MAYSYDSHTIPESSWSCVCGDHCLCCGNEPKITYSYSIVGGSMCNGCQGRGWIETGGGAYVHVCPVCRGTGAGGFVDSGSNKYPIWESSDATAGNCPSCKKNPTAPPSTGCPIGSHYQVYNAY